MADELKEALSEAENQTADTTVPNEETKTPEKTEEAVEGTDFKAELDKAKAIIGHKENVIKTEKEKSADLQDKLDNTPETTDVDPEDIQEQVREAIEQETDNLKKGFVQDTIEDEIDRVATSTEEAELIKFHFRNSVKLNGTTRKEIRDAVETAKLKANKKSIMSTNRELAEALKSKHTSRTVNDGTGEKLQPDEPGANLNADESKLLDKFGTAAKKIHDEAPASNTK